MLEQTVRPFAGSRRMRLVFVGHESQDRMRSPAQQGWRAHHQRRVEEGPPHRAAVVAGEEGRTDRDERTDEEGNRTAPWTGDQTVRVAVRAGDEEHGAEQTSDGVSEWRTHM